MNSSRSFFRQSTFPVSRRYSHSNWVTSIGWPLNVCKNTSRRWEMAARHGLQREFTVFLPMPTTLEPPAHSALKTLLAQN